MVCGRLHQLLLCTTSCLYGIVYNVYITCSLLNQLLLLSIVLCPLPPGEGERVSLGKTAVKARGNVENWLGGVEDAMVSSLKRLAKAGITSYSEDPRSQWVLQQPAQLVIAVSQVFWCHAVEEQLQTDSPSEGLASFYQVCVGP